MKRVDLDKTERYMFGEFLKEMAQLILDGKLNDLRSGISIEQSSVAATRVQVEFGFYSVPEAQELLFKVHANYLMNRDPTRE